MQMRGHERTVAFLRPAGTSYMDQLARALDEYDKPWMATRHELTECVDDVRKALEDVAESMDIPLQIYDYELAEEEPIPSRKATEWIRRSHVITTFNPDHQMLAYITTCMRKNPVMASILAYDDTIDSLLEPIMATTIKVFDERGKVISSPSRFIGLPLTEGQRRTRAARVAQRALEYSSGKVIRPT